MGCPRTAPVSRLPPMPRTLAVAVDSCTQGRGPLRIQCLLSGQKFSGELAAAGGAGATVASSGRHGPFTHCAYSVDTGAGRGEPLCSVQQGAGVCLFSGGRRGFFGRVMRIVGRMRPGVAPPFVESAAIRGILEGLGEGAGAPLRHKKSVRRTVGPSPRTSVVWERPAVSGGCRTVGEAFADADADGMVIDSMRAFADGLDVTVSRRGLVTVHRGGIKGVYDGVLRPILGHGLGRRDLFSHRSRRERADRKAMPLLIKYKWPVLGGEGQRAKFCDMIDKYTHCNYDVVHAGSSHIHITIVDRLDNSSVAVWAVTDDALVIVPQIWTSEASLLRLTEFLSTEFCEGVVGEYEW